MGQLSVRGIGGRAVKQLPRGFQFSKEMVEFLPGSGLPAGAQVGLCDLGVRGRGVLGGGFPGTARALTTQIGLVGADKGVTHLQMLSRANQDRQDNGRSLLLLSGVLVPFGGSGAVPSRMIMRHQAVSLTSTFP